MAEAGSPNSQFFVAGGTLPADATSYVEREADARLFESLSRSEFCYVLNSRQMGKSSICVRTMKRLESSGIRTAFVDLTRIGGRNVTAEQWYVGIAVEIGRALNLRAEILAFWKENAELSSVQRLFGALRDVVIERLAGSIVVFFDEIDATRSLGFNTDEFFAAIRECFNRRVLDSELTRLTFCLLGVALPSDLINSPTSTPFNVGQRIYLRDFTLQEALALAQGLNGQRTVEMNGQLLARVFHWTNGHPYLTQSLCVAIASRPEFTTPGDVDELVSRDLLEPKARETNINLADVSNRAIHAGDLDPEPAKFRADLLSAYERALRHKVIPDDESNRVLAVLKLSGLMRPEGTRLVIRNRIYQQVFDQRWVRENMPNQELRRQTRSYWLGALRTAVVGALVVALVGSLAIKLRILAAENGRLAEVANRERADAQRLEKAAEYRAYVADMAAMRAADLDSNDVLLTRLLDETKDSPFRGVEWEYWSGQLHDSIYESGFAPDAQSLAISPDGKSAGIIEFATHSGGIFSYPQLHRIADVPSMPMGADLYYFGHRWVQFDGEDARTVRLTDAVSGVRQGKLTLEVGEDPNYVAPDGSALDTVRDSTTLSVWQGIPPRRTMQFRAQERIVQSALSKDGKLAAISLAVTEPTQQRPAQQRLLIADLTRRRAIDHFSIEGEACSCLTLSKDGRLAAVGFSRGRVIVRDISRHRNLFDRKPFTGAVSYVALSDDDTRFLVQGDRIVHAYSLNDLRLICKERGGSFCVLAPDGKTFAVGGAGTRVYNVAPPRITSRTLGHARIIGMDQRNQLIVAHLAEVLLLDPDTLETVKKIPSFWPNPTIRVPANSSWHCIPKGSGYEVVSTTDNRPLCELHGAHGALSHFATTVDGGSIAVVDDDTRSLQVFGSKGKLKWSFRPVKDILTFCAWSADGTRVVVEGWNEGLIVLDGQTGHPLRTIPITDPGGLGGEFSHRGHTLAWGGRNFVHVFDLDTNAPETLIAGYNGRPDSVRFSPDDTRLLTGFDDGTVRIWDPKTAALLLRLGSDRGAVVDAVFDNDAHRIFCSDELGTVTVYRMGSPAR